jgi:hypothetical protein
MEHNWQQRIGKTWRRLAVHVVEHEVYKPNYFFSPSAAWLGYKNQRSSLILVQTLDLYSWQDESFQLVIYILW